MHARTHVKRKEHPTVDFSQPTAYMSAMSEQRNILLDADCRPIRRKPVWTIYRLTDPDGRSYVGCTSHPVADRLAQHRAGRTYTELGRAIREQGISAFKYKVLAEAITLSDARAKEIRYIRQLNALAPAGYNQRLVGVPRPMFPVDE
jgi:predicted GIY-YIG superfamily endonuclease